MSANDKVSKLKNLSSLVNVSNLKDPEKLKALGIDPKAFLLSRINNYLNIAIGTVTGAFTGSAWSTVRGFLRDPEYYLSRPGHWYFGLIKSGIIAAVAVFGINYAKKLLKNKLGIDLEAAANAPNPVDSLKNLAKDPLGAVGSLVPDSLDDLKEAAGNPASLVSAVTSAVSEVGEVIAADTEEELNSIATEALSNADIVEDAADIAAAAGITEDIVATDEEA